MYNVRDEAMLERIDVDDKRWCLNVVQCLVYGDAKFNDVVGAVLLLVIVCDDAMI